MTIEEAMHIDWTIEPDLNALRTAHDQLKTDAEGAIAVLEGLAERGSRASMWYLGDAFARGSNIPRDLVRSRHWFRRAAEGGNVYFLHLAGMASFNLYDWSDAIAAFSDSAARDYPPSQYWLGAMYRDGRGVPADTDKAKMLLEKATVAGHLFAKRDLGILYVRGKFGAARIPYGIAMLLSLVKDMILIKSKSMEELEDRIS